MKTLSESRPLSFQDASELSFSLDHIERAIEYIDNMDATSSLESPKRAKVAKVIAKLREAHVLMSEVQS